MRFFLTGSEGQLGSALQDLLGSRGEPVVCRDLELDVADTDAVARQLDAEPQVPDVLVNAAAFTHVDRCERELDTAQRVNGDAPVGLARLCAERDIRLVHVSTDYVFDGEGTRPYTEQDPVAPASVYGASKLRGEQGVLASGARALVVRTSWVFGKGRNFVAAILAQAEKRAAEPDAALRVVDDQTGRPTYAVDLARGLVELLEKDCTGLYHLAGAGEASWWDVARATLDHAGYRELPIERIKTRDLDLDAPRPRYSVLDCGKASAEGVDLRDWREALGAYLDSDHSPTLAGSGAGR